MISVFRLLVLLSCLSSPVKAQDDAITREMAELSEAYADIERKLIEQSAELDRVLTLGYSGPALGKDMADIAENVATLEGRLQGLAEQLADLVKKINYNPIQPFELVVHKGAKDAPPLMGTARPGDRVYLTADIKHAVLTEGAETRLSWALILPDGTASDKLRKSNDVAREGEGDTYSFGVDTTGMELGNYQVDLTHSVVGQPKKQFKTSASFTLAEVSEVQITKMVIDDERTGDVHQEILPPDARPYMFAYFEVPSFIQELSADFNVRDLTTGKTIYQKKGVKKIKPEVEQQRFGVVLDPKKTQMLGGHEYSFSIALKDDLRGNTLKKTVPTAKETITFFYGDEPKRVKVDKLVVSNLEGAKKSLSNVPASPIVYFTNWVKATKPVGAMDVLFRLTGAQGGEAILEKTITQANQKNVDIEQVSLPVDASLLKAGAKYRLETVVSGEGFETVQSTRNFIYAKLASVDISKLVKVSGNITTPGASRSAVNPGEVNSLKLDSKVSFTVPPVSREGMVGTLHWKLNGKRQAIIKLDGGSPNWGFSFGANKSNGNIYSAELIYMASSRSRPKRLYSADFLISLPFTASTFGGDRPLYASTDKAAKDDERKRLPSWRGYSWLRNEVGIRVKASDFGIKAKVTINAVLKETGETLISETKAINLAADEETKLNWTLDQSALKFDLESIFPNIDTSRDLKKTIETKFTVEDDEGYRLERTVSTSQWLPLLNIESEFNEGAGITFSEGTSGDQVGKISPLAVMRGPYSSKITGLGVWDIAGLNVSSRTEELEDWVKAEGARKYNETDTADYYAKSIPLLISLEDSTGKQAVLYWPDFTFRVSVAKPSPSDEGD